MTPSHTIARLAGPVLATIGLGLLTNLAIYKQIATQILANLPLVYFSGVLLLLAGLTILNFHKQWTRDWRSIITALGWLLTLSGAFRIFAPQQAAFFASSATIGSTTFLVGAGIVILIFGGYLTYKGYAA